MEPDGRRDDVLALISEHLLDPRDVLEIGCANGYRLDKIARRYGCPTTGVEPSAEAIADGRLRYPDVRFHRGTASDIPLIANFDLVIVNFVLHWVDRSSILRSVAEIDRTVADNGYLIIGDFLPSYPQRVPYKHKLGLWTYKQNYAALFLASGLYRVVAVETGHHDSLMTDDGSTGTWLLRKSLTENYIERRF